MRDELLRVLESYDTQNIHIGTIGSHSALNILKGAKDEGFGTVCICRERERKVYESFGVADRFIIVKDYRDLLEERIQGKLREMNTILIPHGSFNAYIGKFNELLVPIFGNRELMVWETDREKQREWLIRAGVKMPKKYSVPEEIEGLAIVKFPGAKGGKGYFIVSDAEEFYRISERMVKTGLITREDVMKAEIQEYILGTNIYFSFFYSPVYGRIELIAVDRRYESTADALGKVPAKEQIKGEIDPTYTVIGNFPVVLRESLLVQAFEAAENVVKVSKEIAYPGMVGAFCIESIFDENAQMYVFEISARIVAGTNVGIPSSPYSYILFGENMYMGRRIARELKLAVEKDMLGELIY
ncbi:formate--phosphoribosylaminoimidazolecarboxamide ligase [Archaeoglobus neptunius]|uniref:formate--phosphoribosylaminoimidazolecarboxamide ligase n=1 Tax=Archaeoglobus neptunius TaxID=2798580 RepID=UPI0019255A0E|nr:formate--phosphoribosylaminoimidazolecarboxamide ligase [Archaeoglobus neptunius]